MLHYAFNDYLTQSVGEKQKRAVAASSARLTISRKDLKKRDYGKMHLVGQPDMLVGDLPTQKLSQEQLEAVARFLYDVLSVKEN